MHTKKKLNEKIALTMHIVKARGNIKPLLLPSKRGFMNIFMLLKNHKCFISIFLLLQSKSGFTINFLLVLLLLLLQSNSGLRSIAYTTGLQ